MYGIIRVRNFRRAEKVIRLNEKAKRKFPDFKNVNPEFLQAIEKLRFIDDSFMVKVFEDIPCTEFLLRQILNREDLSVKSVQSQYGVKNLSGRSVCLDIFAVDEAGKLYNIEIQRSSSGATLKRARYNSSLIDAHVTNPGDDFKDLCDVYVIFITENDVFKKGLSVYHIEKVIKETGEDVDDGSHIIYVNGTVRDETALGWVMHDFFCTDPKDMHYGIFSERAKFFKETKEGVSQMCQIMQDFWDKGFKKGEARGEARGEVKGKREIAVELAKKGWDAKQIAEIAGCDSATVKNWLDEAKKVN